MRLTPGMRLILPSGNSITLLHWEQGRWLCEYSLASRLRGQVEFSSSWLKKHAVPESLQSAIVPFAKP